MKKDEKKRIKREKGSERPNKNKVFCLVKGMAAAFAVTCIIFIGFGILLTYTDLSETHLPLVSLACTGLSAAVAGFDWAFCMKRRGVLWGLGAGAAYMVLLYLITALAADQFVPTLSAGMALIVALAAGAVGGILGVNRK